MDIHHVGSSALHTPHHDLHLKNILHVPQATKNLLSTSRLAQDNHAFVEYWPNYFFVKDQDTRKFFFKVVVWVVSTLCRHGSPLLHPWVGKLMVSPSHHPRFGIGF
jgi:hypothetical protein